MFSQSPLPVSQLLLAVTGMRMFVYNEDRIPKNVPVVVISNHRSFMDASVLMQALGHPVRIACHHYMGQTPVMREFIELLGCFPLDKPEQRQKNFLTQATDLLSCGEWVGIFPEGTQPMVEQTDPREIGKFHRGFAHLALRAPVPNLAVLPVAIASSEETTYSTVPMRWLRLFDPSEPLFDRPGSHPMVVYRRANVSIGRPYWINAKHREQYEGKQAKKIVTDITEHCREQIAAFLKSDRF